MGKLFLLCSDFPFFILMPSPLRIIQRKYTRQIHRPGM
nr:MAG TPA: hypothetical protein [Caudoviricetes sp.]